MVPLMLLRLKTRYWRISTFSPPYQPIAWLPDETVPSGRAKPKFVEERVIVAAEANCREMRIARGRYFFIFFSLEASEEGMRLPNGKSIIKF